jgi:8-oxo-dGTP pyrophosphatase MutT (NUDIX family)
LNARLVGAEELAPDPDLGCARALLERWTPPDPEQDAARRELLAWIERFPSDAHLRSCTSGHLTASALIVDHARERALLTHHKKLGRWLQLGGHCDGDANLVHVAWREASEESGIVGLRIDPTPIDVDVHVIPARPGEERHLHLDTRFVVVAPPGARAVASAESIALGWFSPAELDALATDASVRRLFRTVFRPS